MILFSLCFLFFLQNNGVWAIEDALEKAKDAMEITNKVLEVGGAFEPLSAIFEPIAALGELVLAIVDIFTRQPDPVLEKLKEIEKQIDMLSQRMTQQFADLRFFITEQSFDEKFIQPAATLQRFMLDTLRFPGNDSIKAFHQEYKKNRPQSLAYTLTDTIRMDVTNPLVQAMNADEYKTAKTFNKWKNVLTSIMVQLLYIETFANGMFENRTFYGPQRIAEQVTELNVIIEQKGRHYKNSYWPTVVQTLMVNIQQNYQSSSHDEKARMLRDRLNEILQEDIYTYFAIVYDYGSSYNYHGFSGMDHLESFRLGKCNMAVMRTQKSWSPNWEVKNAVESHIAQDKHKKKGKNRCIALLREAEKYSPYSLANAFIVGGHPAIYYTGSTPPGVTSLSHGITWISTYGR